MIPLNILKTRQAQLTKVLNTSRLDAVALNPGPTLTYLTGLHFHLSERPIILIFVAGKIPAIILPELEAPKLDQVEYKLRAFTYSENPSEWPKVFSKALEATQIIGKRVGTEPRRMRMLEMKILEKSSPNTFFLDASNEVAALRMYKDPGEIAAMQKAARIAENALQETLPLIKIGMTEQELAGELTVQLLRAGSTPAFPFSPIVASGPNSAKPHATPSMRALAPGDLLVIDWGAATDDYYSDITRTFALGEVDEELSKIAKIVLEANTAARKKAGPGVEASAVDLAARSVIMKKGYAQYFTHRTGHGLGMEGHEEPYIRGDSNLPLQVGMVFTIEPGIYLPDRGGVRIEDDVVITKDGMHSLTSLPRELIQVG